MLHSPRPWDHTAAMLDIIRKNSKIAGKFLDAGFFWSDLVADIGTTSKPLRSLGFSDPEMRDRSYQQRIHPDDRHTYFALWERVHQGWEDTLLVEYRLADSDGTWHWVETHAVVISRTEAGGIHQIVGTDRIIDGRKHAQLFLERQARDALRKLEVAGSLLIVENASTRDQELTVRLRGAMQRLAESLNFTHCDIHLEDDRGPVCLLAYPEEGSYQDPAAWRALYARIRESLYPVITDDLEAAGGFQSCLAVPLHVDAAFVGAMLLWHEDPGHFTGADLFNAMSAASVVSVALHNHRFYKRTVTELERDELTGFLSRRSFDRDAQAFWDEYRQLYDSSAVAMLDIDHFKQINDHYGHQRGDEVIRALAAAVQRELRQDDLLGRYGGEEFVVVLPNVAVTTAFDIMERIRGAIENLDVCEFAGNVTISIGVAVADAAEDRAALIALPEMIRRADTALYRAKSEGRNRVILDS